MKQKEEMRREKEVARLKAANERAIARKIAKESMELIEDERLELMEVAALIKGLPSMLALDFETLQNLDAYRGELMIYIIVFFWFFSAVYENCILYPSDGLYSFRKAGDISPNVCKIEKAFCSQTMEWF